MSARWSNTHNILIAGLLTALLLFALPSSALADCTSPTAIPGAIIYNGSSKIMQYCEATSWIAMHPPGSGSGGCATPTAVDGSIIYNSHDRVMQVCAGNVWRAMGPVGGSAEPSNNWVQISAGSSHTCAIKNDGTLWCWGSDSSGQLGNGAITGTQVSPSQESTAATDWSTVSAAQSHTCALKTNGTVWCWGSDSNGQLGNGATTGNQVSPVQESTAATNWSAVEAGYNYLTGGPFTCALKTNGTIWCWGNDASGQLGNGATTGDQVSPVQESTAATNWASISAGEGAQACAKKTTGTLWCWGQGGSGKLGYGGTTAQTSPIQVSGAATDWASVSAGATHTCAVKTTGTLWCWGSDQTGQIGNGATSGDQMVPVQEVTTATDWALVTASETHTCAIKTNGTIWCWGSDGSQQLGNSSTLGLQHSPVQESTAATDWVSASGGTYHTCATKTNGTLWCWGNNASGQLGNGGVVSPAEGTPIQESGGAADWAQVSSGNGHVCAVKNDDTLWCWGQNVSGQTGTGVTGGNDINPTQEASGATNWGSVSAGVLHSCAVKTNGTLWCWGNDTNGAVGNGAGGSPSVPEQESSAATNWSSVSAANSFTCAVRTNGTLYCWGSDSNGQIGNGATTGNRTSPTQEVTAAINWASVSAGSNFACAVKTTGTLWCWGDDFFGKLGNGPGITGDQNSPVQEATAATNWAAVSAGFSHACALKTDGTLWCWGAGSDGRLGNGTTASSDTPIQEVTGATDWAFVSAGSDYTCALKTDDTLWCWGSDDNGQIGSGAGTADQMTPLQITTDDWVSASAGSGTTDLTCGVKTDGTLWCWGINANGGLGMGYPVGETPASSEACVNPVRHGGTLVYNSDTYTLQYCDGLNWVAIGKVP